MSYNQAYMEYKTPLLNIDQQGDYHQFLFRLFNNTSTLHLICSQSNSNLFRIESMFKLAKIISLRLSLRKDFKVLLQQPTLSMSYNTLVLYLSIIILDLKSTTPSIKSL